MIRQLKNTTSREYEMDTTNESEYLKFLLELMWLKEERLLYFCDRFHQMGMIPSIALRSDVSYRYFNIPFDCTYNHRRGESEVKWHDRLQLLNLFRCEANAECFDISKQMFNLPPTNDGEDVRCL
jgi:hypothetical protein